MREHKGKNHQSDARLTDLLKPSTEYLSDEDAAKRYDICLGCKHFKSVTKRCGLCGCFMKIKTQIAHAECPAGKW